MRKRISSVAVVVAIGIAGLVVLCEHSRERCEEKAVEGRAEHERDKEGVELDDGVGSVSDAKGDRKDLSDLCGRHTPCDEV